MRYRSCVAVVLLSCLLTPVVLGQTVLAREGKGRLERREGNLVLHLEGTPYEMGLQHGRLLREQVVRMTQLIYDSTKLADRKEYQLYKTLRQGMHQRLRPHVPARFVEEMKGLAEGSGVAFEVIEGCNLFPEAFHCSGMALMGKATHDGSLYHVRILDYFTEIGLQESAIVVEHEPSEGHKWLNIGFAGFIGSVTGMNDRQIAIGEMGGDGAMHWDGMPMAFLVRDALERAATLDEAVDIFKSTPRTCEYYYVISDGKVPDARGIWSTPDDFEAFKPGETMGFVEVKKLRRGAAGNKAFLRGIKTQTDNHRIGFQDQNGEVEGFLASPPEDCVILSGYDRYGHFVERLMPDYGKVDEQALMAMIKRPVSMSHNLHCAIFQPSTLTAWVAVAAADGHLACDQPYLVYRLEPRAAAAHGGAK